MENAKKNLVFHFGGERHASFPQKPVVKLFNHIFFPIFFSKDVVDMEVQENVIGAVIGPAGRSIVELQQFSGARIQVSKKGAFSPGTR